MEVHDFIQKLEELMGYKVKIKYTHTTKGNTWELTVKGKDEDEVIPIIKRADREMRDFSISGGEPRYVACPECGTQHIISTKKEVENAV